MPSRAGEKLTVSAPASRMSGEHQRSAPGVQSDKKWYSPAKAMPATFLISSSSSGSEPVSKSRSNCVAVKQGVAVPAAYIRSA